MKRVREEEVWDSGLGITVRFFLVSHVSLRGCVRLFVNPSISPSVCLLVRTLVPPLVCPLVRQFVGPSVRPQPLFLESRNKDGERLMTWCKISLSFGNIHFKHQYLIASVILKYSRR